MNILEFKKYCQRHNGPKGWIVNTKIKVTALWLSQFHINSATESRPNFTFKISTNLQLQCYVVGQWGEGSKDLHHFIRVWGTRSSLDLCNWSPKIGTPTGLGYWTISPTALHHSSEITGNVLVDQGGAHHTCGKGGGGKEGGDNEDGGDEKG